MKIQKSLVIFFVVLSSCAHRRYSPVVYDANWIFHKSIEGKNYMCLDEQDTIELAQILQSCGAK
jgi:hypothetical protein